MEIVVKDSFKVVGIVVESDWQNIHQKMAVAWQEFKQRVGEIEQRKGNHFLDISLAVNDGIFQQMIRNLQATICLVIGLIFVSSFAWASSDRIGVAGPLTFGKTAFELAWSNQPSYQYYVQKYLPKGETLEDFSQQLAIHLVITNAKPEAAVQEQIRYLDERQDSFDPVVNYAVSKSPDGEYMLDFLVSEIEDDCLTLVEFNIYRYKQIRLSNNQPALIIYTYSARSYDDQIIPFLESLVSERVGYLNQMILSEIPSVEIGIYPFPNE